MEEIVRYYYTQSLQKVFEEGKIERERETWLNFLCQAETNMKNNPKAFDEEKVCWFESLVPGVIEFARYCALDLQMRLTPDCHGLILFETNCFELTSGDDEVLRKFWVYLCQKGQLTISHTGETFQLEFRFALYDEK